MKFTKEQAVENLNSLLTNGGKKTLRLSKRTLESHVENLMTLIADEEMELADFVAKVKPMVETANSNAEHDQSEFVKEYEKKHPAPKPDPKEPPKDDDATKALLDRLAAMEAREAERENASKLTAKRAEIAKYLKDNNVEDSQWVEKMLAITTIGVDDNAEDRGKALLEVYNISHAAEGGFSPRSPRPGDEGADDAFAELRELRKARSAQQ